MEAGYEVQIRGVWFDEKLAAWDGVLCARHGIRFTPALDLRSRGLGGRWTRLAERAKGRWARNRFLRTGKFSRPLLGDGARELLAAAREGGADLTLVHSEAGLWVAHELKEEGGPGWH